MSNNNIQYTLPVNIRSEIISNAQEYTKDYIYNNDWVDTAHCSYIEGATAYATKLHQANETIKVLEYDNNKLNGQVEGLTSAVEELKGTGPRWVKASERLPGWRQSVKWKSHEGAEVGKHPLFAMTDPGTAEAMDGWEWLDESAAGIITYNPRYELCLALRDMVKLVKRIYGDDAIPVEYQKRIEAADGMLNKHFKVTDVLRGESAAGREEDAVAFAQWLANERWQPRINTEWARYETIYSDVSVKTTAELYELFKQQKEK